MYPLYVQYLSIAHQYGIPLIREIERVQHRATKLIPYLRHLPYHQRMQRLQLPSLQFRRDRADVINTFRIVRNIDNITPTHFFTFTEYSSTRQHQHKIYPPCSQKRIGQNSLSSQVWKTWNSLPSEIVASTTVQSIKSSLASTDFYTRSYHNPFWEYFYICISWFVTVCFQLFCRLTFGMFQLLTDMFQLSWYAIVCFSNIVSNVFSYCMFLLSLTLLYTSL